MKNSTVSEPRLYPSQLRYRLGLVRKRMASNPVDSMNFVMMDLERPALRERHASFCTTDLTGRLLQFYTTAEQVDDVREPRMHELFERIMNNRKPSGSFSNYIDNTKNADTPYAGGHFISGLVRYYWQTGDMRALQAAIDLAPGAHPVYGPEGLADLYLATKDPKYVEQIRGTARVLPSPENQHSHSYMTALRGILRVGIAADDAELIEIFRRHRNEILEGGYIKPNGDVPEAFPNSVRNEGCSIADWIIMNLMWAHYTGDEAAYEIAEHSLYNALFFNQLVTGGFGHRYFSPYGYKTYIEEAWWCCTTTGGLAMVEYARHAVTLREGKLYLNFLLPGEYKLMTEEGEVTVSVTTAYPTNARTIVKVTGTKQDLQIRVPSFIKGFTCEREDTLGGYTLRIGGRMGHYAEVRNGRSIMKYGPLVLAPMTYFWDQSVPVTDNTTIPEGYQHQGAPNPYLSLALPTPNEDGFCTLGKEGKPMWIVFEEGEMANFPGAEVAAATVPCMFRGKGLGKLYFWPLFIATSNLTLMDVVSDFEI